MVNQEEVQSHPDNPAPDRKLREEPYECIGIMANNELQARFCMLFRQKKSLFNVTAVTNIANSWK
jgi:hypothetical protein